MVTHPNNTQSPHIIPSDEDSISSEPPLPITTDIQPLPPPPTKDPTTEPSDETLHKNSVEPLSVRTINLVQNDATNIPLVPPSSTLAPCEIRIQFKFLNLNKIFGCCWFCNQNYLTKATSANLVNSGLLLSTIGSFATISNSTKRKPIKKRRT